ncbi:Hypothetical predicted protein, partial [Paramuricea clavata]
MIETDETALMCRTATCRSEESYLKSELEVANSKIIDLQAKIKHLENEKSSLTTAIRIIQEDNSLRPNVNNTDDDQGGNQWVELNKKKKKRKRDQTQKLQEIPTIATHENCPLETTCADESNATVKKNVIISSRQGRKDGYPNTRGNHQNPVKKTRMTSQQSNNFKMATVCTESEEDVFDDFVQNEPVIEPYMLEPNKGDEGDSSGDSSENTYSEEDEYNDEFERALQHFPGVNAENAHSWKKQLSLFVAMR